MGRGMDSLFSSKRLENKSWRDVAAIWIKLSCTFNRKISMNRLESVEYRI